MPRIVRGGLIQAKNVLGPEHGLPAIKKAMIDKHVALIAEAATKKVQVLCLQELFYGPYFCAEQETRWYDLTEQIPDGPTVTLMRELAQEAPHGDRRPDLRGGPARRLLQHRRRDRRRRRATSASTARPTSRTASRASGRSSTSGPATSAIRCSRPPTPRSASTSATTATSPRARGRSGLDGAEIVFNPSATVAGLSEYLWKLEQPAHAVANGYFVGAINRVGIEAPWKIGEFYGQSYFCDPRGQIVAQAPARQGRDRRRRPRPRHDRRGAHDLAVLPRPPARRLRPAGRALGHAALRPPGASGATELSRSGCRHWIPLPVQTGSVLSRGRAAALVGVAALVPLRLRRSPGSPGVGSRGPGPARARSSRRG